MGLMVHEAAATGFERNAETYQRARPTYHPALVARFVGRYAAGDVVEIGAGTGIFTEQLARQGVEVTAVEPVAAMGQQLRERLPDVDVRVGTAEDLPVEDASADVVVAAQAFHWFDYDAALEEIHRVLRPGGHLVTVWNVKAAGEAWVERFNEIVERHAGDTPRHRTMRWRRAIDGDERFELVDDWGVDNPQPTTPDGIVARALSTSFIAALPEPDQQAVASDIQQAIRPFGDILDFPYRSELQAWRRAE